MKDCNQALGKDML